MNSPEVCPNGPDSWTEAVREEEGGGGGGGGGRLGLKAPEEPRRPPSADP